MENLLILKRMFNNIKVFLVSIFSVVSIEITEALNAINGILELTIQLLIGILTIVYLVIKISRQIGSKQKNYGNNKTNETKK